MIICPNCGKDTATLQDFTGWCDECSPATSISTTANYLAVNADKLEYYLTTGQATSVSNAVDLLADPKNGHRPNCLVCGDVIKHAPKTAIFCRKKPECRRFSRRYIYLYRTKGFTKTEALAQILTELT